MRGIEFSEMKKYPPHPVDTSNWGESVAIFGDSNAYGFEIREKYRLHNVLKTDRHVNNLAYPSEGNLHILYKMSYYFEKYGLPSAVIVIWSALSRVPTIREHHAQRNTMWSTSVWSEDIWQKEWAGNPKYALKAPEDVQCWFDVIRHNPTTLKHINLAVVSAIRFMCRDINYHERTPVSFIFDDKMEILEFKDHARDGQHPGPRTLQWLAEEIGEL